jgi:HEPN domain-containing protein
MMEIRQYSWALFVGHLCVEKLLKAIYIDREKKEAPYIHNLQRLAEYAGLDVDERRMEMLATLTTFNLRAMYLDYKLRFHIRCTAEYTEKWIENIKELREWLKQEF